MVGMFPFTHGILSAAAYVTGAVNFDGTNDYLRASTSFTNSTNSNKFSFSAWIKLSTAMDAASFTFYTGRDGANNQPFFRNSTSGLHFEHVTAGNSTAYNLQSTEVLTSTWGWIHIAVGVDNTSTSTGTFAVFVNGATSWSSTSALVSTSAVDWTSTGTHTFFANNSASELYAGDVADVYLETVAATLASTANITLFRGSNGKPVNLGSSGATPSGAQPVVFLTHVAGATAADFDDNLGYGGTVPIVGALTESTSSPTD